RQWPTLYRRWQAQKSKAAEAQQIEQRKNSDQIKVISIPQIITVRDLAVKLGLPVTRVISELMKNGIFASLNERVDYDTANIIADDLGFKVELQASSTITEQSQQEEKLKDAISKEAKENLKPRPPVVVVMGHVDHGKTKLLDAIRKTDVVSGEAGGITQHIGAYQVEKKGRKITFIDTPGHEAFTAMRSRGAKIADVAILVVAADDSIMPQTVEALRIIENAKLPMLVAVNKIDKPEANLDKVKQDLSRYNLVPEDWGGKTIVVPVSALKGKGIDELLEMVLLVADLEKEKIIANPDRLALGTIVESRVNKNEGPVATILVQAGTLRLSDALSIENTYYGKARAMKDWNGHEIKEAGPSTPVRILGFKEAPQVGDIVEVVTDIESLTKDVKKRHFAQGSAAAQAPAMVQKKEEEKAAKQLINLIIKADVLGSLEAIVESLEKIEHPEVGLEIISKGLGNITENDIARADGGKALILGFNVKMAPRAESQAREKKIVPQTYKVIYDLIEDVKGRLEKMLKPEIIRTDLGEATLLQVFRNEGQFAIFGGKVTKGKVEAGAKVSVYRDKVEVTKGTIEQLQHNKQVAKEVYTGQEFGIKFKGKADFQAGDTLVIYWEVEKVRKL
ncbi:translation initiation factor IF-2, partial [Candidatus Uhrbacteria bacterium]|nr:translation initiation factor IF-2 [Candidatus Uhrbacteria bacterium]